MIVLIASNNLSRKYLSSEVYFILDGDYVISILFFFFYEGNNEFSFTWLICVYDRFKKEYHRRPLFTENKTVSENALIVVGIFFLHFFSMLRLLDDVTQLSLNNVRLLWCNKKGKN